ncbi:MAG TPA: thioredoxin family protein [archaeon]|nr:thioredoxin family protein [archaeon]
MVICIVAAVVLGILGIFSARYRKIAKEAFSCVKRMATFRPCETGFDDKVRSHVTSRLMKRSEKVAGVFYRNFKLLSVLFTVTFFFSAGYTGYTIYNLVVYGSCDPVHPEDCVFSPGTDPNRVICPYQNLSVSSSVATIGNFRNIESASVEGRPTVYFFGTTWCPHCAWERPIFTNVTAKFSGYIDAKVTEIDLEQPPLEMEVFKHYSTDGKIPLIVIGGKYFRVGSGESLGQSVEENVLTALLCKASGDPIAECSLPQIRDLESRL